MDMRGLWANGPSLETATDVRMPHQGWPFRAETSGKFRQSCRSPYIRRNADVYAAADRRAARDLQNMSAVRRLDLSPCRLRLPHQPTKKVSQQAGMGRPKLSDGKMDGDF